MMTRHLEGICAGYWVECTCRMEQEDLPRFRKVGEGNYC